MARRETAKAFHAAQALKRENPGAFAVLMKHVTEEERRLLDPPPEPVPLVAPSSTAPDWASLSRPAPPGRGR